MATRIKADWLADRRVQAVFRILADAGHKVLFVGGCVRNSLIGMRVSDIDMTTSARPAEVMALAETAGIKALPTGVEHGTVTLVHDGFSCEVTTLRRDVDADGRHAIVAFGSDIAEDAARRDFTMNALYATRDGQVLDPLGEGLADLWAHRVRFIGDASQRIREDYLRILRFFRFHAWYGDPEVGPDPEALAAIGSNLAGLETLSRERVGHDILKLLAADDPVAAVGAMQQVGVLGVVLPGADVQGLVPLVHLEGENRVSPDSIRRLAALGRVENIQARLRLSRRDAQRLALLLDLVENPMGLAEVSYRHGAEVALDVALLRAALAGDALKQGWRETIAQGASARFPVRARDLAPLQGKALGDRLGELEKRWIASGFRLTQAELLQ